MQFLKLVPKNLLSRTVGKIAAVENPSWLATQTRDWFIDRYKINMNEAELPLEQYPSLAKLFTRKLKAGIRPIGQGVVHPCDSVLTCAEVIESDTLLQVKDRHYSLEQMLTSTVDARPYLGGAHLIYYLCPTDYHRVHCPVDAEVTSVVHVPGHLWPVNNWSVQNIENLFAVNERVIFNLRTSLGPVALVMVGATNVGQITVSFDRSVVSNTLPVGSPPRMKTYERPLRLRKGDELGIFNMGSTVVMFYPPKMLSVLPKLGPTRLGESL